jgi:hypothetical protein
MGLENQPGLKRLQYDLPEGLVAPAAWLAGKGYSHQLLKKYRDHGWLESPVRGVYRRPGPPLKWQHVVGSLQNLLELPVHVAGRTALEMQGLAHYLRLSRGETIHLCSPEPLPKWIDRLGVEERFVARPDHLFSPPDRLPTNDNVRVEETHAEYSLTAPLRVGLTQTAWGAWDSPITHSTVERAFLELLEDVPKRESVEDADAMMQGLTTLSPRRLMELLTDCRSVKVKRLFFALADRHQHAWFKHLDASKIDFGRGKRGSS